MTACSYQTITVDVDGRGIASIVLNRPQKRNAMSSRMIDELTHVASTLGTSRETRAIVLSGAGAYFCAGGDLEWMQAQLTASRGTRIHEARKLAEMLDALNSMPVPLIGRVHGGAFGGGVGLMCVCDVVLADEGTKFGLTETRLGLIPATIGPYVVARMGEGKARQIVMSARIFDASEALRLDLVSACHSSADLDAAVAREVSLYSAVAPGAVGKAKALVRALGPRIDAEVVNDTIRRLADAWEDEEASQGIGAFLEKRRAPWAPEAKV